MSIKLVYCKNTCTTNEDDTVPMTQVQPIALNTFSTKERTCDFCSLNVKYLFFNQ